MSDLDEGAMFTSLSYRAFWILVCYIAGFPECVPPVIAFRLLKGERNADSFEFNYPG